MKNQVTKQVDVFGSEIIATQTEAGEIFAGVGYFCKALGMNKKQRDYQVKKVQTDDILKGGSTKFSAGVLDPNNETIGLQIDYLPIWLTKISITPAMKRDNPELSSKLLNFQLKAKDILADAFLHGRKSQQHDGIIQKSTVPAPLTKTWYKKNYPALMDVGRLYNCSMKTTISHILIHLGGKFDLEECQKIYSQETGKELEFMLDMLDFFPEMEKTADDFINKLLDNPPRRRRTRRNRAK